MALLSRPQPTEDRKAGLTWGRGTSFIPQDTGQEEEKDCREADGAHLQGLRKGSYGNLGSHRAFHIQTEGWGQPMGREGSGEEEELGSVLFIA